MKTLILIETFTIHTISYVEAISILHLYIHRVNQKQCLTHEASTQNTYGSFMRGLLFQYI
jgi:hypothetical protein